MHHPEQNIQAQSFDLHSCGSRLFPLHCRLYLKSTFDDRYDHHPTLKLLWDSRMFRGLHGKTNRSKGDAKWDINLTSTIACEILNVMTTSVASERISDQAMSFTYSWVCGRNMAPYTAWTAFMANVKPGSSPVARDQVARAGKKPCCCPTHSHTLQISSI